MLSRTSVENNNEIETEKDCFYELNDENQLDCVPIKINRQPLAKSESQIVVSPLTKKEALSTVVHKSVPYATARLLYALNTILMGVTMSKLGKEQVAAGSFFTSLQYLFVGIPQGVMLSTGILFSEQNGAGEFKELGKISRASWKLGLISAICASAALIVAPYIMGSAGAMDSNVQKYVEEYVDYFSLAVPAILVSIADQQIAVATKDAYVPLGFITIYSGMASAFGIPMSLGKLGEAVSGVKGYGISTAISSWLGLLGMRLYYHFNKSHYEKYDLFQLKYPENNYFKDLMNLGWKFGAQAGAEFANLTATSLLLSAYGSHSGKPALQMIVPSIQIASAWGLVSMGLGQGIATLIANLRGTMKKALTENDIETADTCKENIRKLSELGLILGTAISVGLAAVCFFEPGLFSNIFLSDDLADADVKTANELLQISSVGLILDTIRNMYAGNLKGFKDVNYSTMASFVMMTVVFSGAGAGLLYGNDSLTQLMWLRNLSIGAAMIMSGLRWRRYNNMEPIEQVLVGDAQNKNAQASQVSKEEETLAVAKPRRTPCSFFKDLFYKDKSNYQDILVENENAVESEQKSRCIIL